VIKNVGTPISFIRVIVLGASLVCSVLNTVWPVNEAWTAISAVSKSRISPTRMRSGSCRKMARRQAAKVTPISASIGIWTNPSMSYSTGSSVVMILSSTLFNSARAEYSVVVLPDPVGPVTRIMPLGMLMHLRSRASVSSSKPTRVKSRATTERSRTRITTLSPNMVGSTLTRRSTG